MAGRSAAFESGALDPLDVEVGARIRFLRRQRRISQTELGQALGVTFQQVQKYERGSNRVAVATLIRIADKLEVSPTELLGVEGDAAPKADWSVLSSPGGAEFAKAFGRLKSPGTRKAVLRLVNSLAEGEDDSGGE